MNLSPSIFCRRTAAIAILSLCPFFFTPSVQAQLVSVWIGGENGDWSDPMNWDNGIIPNDPSHTAIFEDNQNDATVNIGGEIRIGVIVLNNNLALNLVAGVICNGPDEPISIIGTGTGTVLIDCEVKHCGIFDDRPALSSVTFGSFIEGNGDDYIINGDGDTVFNGGFCGDIHVNGSGVLAINGANNFYQIDTVSLASFQSLVLGQDVIIEVQQLEIAGIAQSPGNYPFGTGLIVLLDGDCFLGDVNQDGQVDLLDVAPFVELLIDGGIQCEADIDQNGELNLLDIQPFVDILNGG